MCVRKLNPPTGVAEEGKKTAAVKNTELHVF